MRQAKSSDHFVLSSLASAWAYIVSTGWLSVHSYGRTISAEYVWCLAQSCAEFLQSTEQFAEVAQIRAAARGKPATWRSRRVWACWYIITFQTRISRLLLATIDGPSSADADVVAVISYLVPERARISLIQFVGFFRCSEWGVLQRSNSTNGARYWSLQAKRDWAGDSSKCSWQ